MIFKELVILMLCVSVVYSISCWEGFSVTLNGEHGESAPKKKNCSSGTTMCEKTTGHGKNHWGASADCGKDCSKEGCHNADTDKAKGERCCCKGELCYSEDDVKKWLKEKSSRQTGYLAAFFSSSVLLLLS